MIAADSFVAADYKPAFEATFDGWSCFHYYIDNPYHSACLVLCFDGRQLRVLDILHRDSFEARYRSLGSMSDRSLWQLGFGSTAVSLMARTAIVMYEGVDVDR